MTDYRCNALIPPPFRCLSLYCYTFLFGTSCVINSSLTAPTSLYVLRDACLCCWSRLRGERNRAGIIVSQMSVRTVHHLLTNPPGITSFSHTSHAHERSTCVAISSHVMLQMHKSRRHRKRKIQHTSQQTVAVVRTAQSNTFLNRRLCIWLSGLLFVFLECFD